MSVADSSVRPARRARCCVGPGISGQDSRHISFLWNGGRLGFNRDRCSQLRCCWNPRADQPHSSIRGPSSSWPGGRPRKHGWRVMRCSASGSSSHAGPGCQPAKSAPSPARPQTALSGYASSMSKLTKLVNLARIKRLSWQETGRTRAHSTLTDWMTEKE